MKPKPRGDAAAGKAQIITHVEPDLRDAVHRWAESEDRTVSAQVRKTLRDNVPVRFLDAPPG
ncbi:hypothetical protein [Desertimonas flava]|uniref:hypothetical protein n=1 Tax=Desertimonas flava TaxID=2064846 RepID=UPI0013C403CE|nr:hypothetical protein [Desertimonas flava]